MKPYQIIHPDGGVEASFDYMGQVYDYMYQKMIATKGIMIARMVSTFGNAVAVVVTKSWSKPELSGPWLSLVKSLYEVR